MNLRGYCSISSPTFLQLCQNSLLCRPPAPLGDLIIKNSRIPYRDPRVKSEMTQGLGILEFLRKYYQSYNLIYPKKRRFHLVLCELA